MKKGAGRRWPSRRERSEERKRPKVSDYRYKDKVKKAEKGLARFYSLEGFRAKSSLKS